MGPTDEEPRLTPVLDTPPSSRRRIRKIDWMQVLGFLDEHPGEWAKVGEFNSSVGTHIRQGEYEYIDPTVYEVRQGKIDGKPHNRVWIYMRKIV
jgi:hypothetical protein